MLNITDKRSSSVNVESKGSSKDLKPDKKKELIVKQKSQIKVKTPREKSQPSPKITSLKKKKTKKL